MEHQLLDILAATQSNDPQTRLAAELRLKGLYSDQSFPGALVTLGAHPDVALPNRILALVVLKQFVGKGWSPALEDFDGDILLSDEVKSNIKNRLLAMVFDGNTNSKVINQTAVIVSRIARADFPEDWPTLLDLLLSQQPTANDAVTEAILIVLSELIQDGLDEDQFYQSATGLVKFFHDVAVDGSKKLLVRAHALSVFRMCFDSVETLKDREETGIKEFVQNICTAWSQFFKDVLNEAMPSMPTTEEENEAENEVATTWRGVVALKIQVIAVRTKVGLVASQRTNSAHRRLCEYSTSSRISCQHRNSSVPAGPRCKPTAERTMPVSSMVRNRVILSLPLVYRIPLTCSLSKNLTSFKPYWMLRVLRNNLI